MLLQNDQVRHIGSIVHEGKVVVVATRKDGVLVYTVRQDGFEDTYLHTPPAQRTGWEAWDTLKLPADRDDTSVLDLERTTLTLQSDPTTYLLRSRYSTRDDTAVAPVQLVSNAGCIYVFRQSRAGALLCDRFVLDGMTNKLVPKIEVRFKRSRQRNTPSGGTKRTPGGLQSFDTLDFTDTVDAPFYEPTIELSLVKNLQDGWFSVALVPTNEHDRYRWHVFAYNSQSRKVEIVSIRASDEGLFDVKDYTVVEPRSPDDATLLPRTIPGIVRRALNLQGAQVTGGPAAALYYLQRETANPNTGDRQLLKGEARLMLVVPTDQGAVTLSFAIAGDGTLSQINPTPDSSVARRADEKAVLLPMSTLDDIKAYGAAAPVPQGTVVGVSRATPDDGADNLVVVTSPETTMLGAADSVEIKGTATYDGLYTVSGVAGDSFQIDPQLGGAPLGTWQKQDSAATGLTFDGMVMSCQRTADGKLQISAANHGLVNGDQVELLGTQSYDGVYPITRLDDGHFVIERSWVPPEARNVRVESLKRRGIVLDGQGDYVELPAASIPAGQEITVSLWAKGAAGLPRETYLLEATDQDGARILALQIPCATGVVRFDCGRAGGACDRVEKQAAVADYSGTWAHWAFTKNAATGEMKIYRNGALWQSVTGKTAAVLSPGSKAGSAVLGRASTAAAGGYYPGTVAEVRIYSRALPEKEIRDTMYLALTGREPGLMGYWRLGAIIEESTRTVLDFSMNGRDGTVKRDGAQPGGAYVSAVTLSRTLSGGVTPAVRYSSEDLCAVTRRATYVEELELKINGPLPVNPNNADGAGHPLFLFSYWGKLTTSSDTRIPIDPSLVLQAAFTDLSNGWWRASCRFTIPDSISLLRTFEIGTLKGTWTSLEIRRHKLRMVSDAIHEDTYTDSIPLDASAVDYVDLQQKVRELGRREQLEVPLLEEKARLEEWLSRLSDLAGTQRDLDALTPVVAALTQEATALQNAYNAALADPLNYYCYVQLQTPAGLKNVLVSDVGTYESQPRVVTTGATGSRAKFLKLPADGSYTLWMDLKGTWRAVKICDTAQVLKTMTDAGSEIRVVKDASGDTYRFLMSWPQNNDNNFLGLYSILRTGYNENPISRVQSGVGDAFKLNKTQDVANQPAIDAARAAWTDKKAELDARVAQRAALQAILTDGLTKKTEWEARLLQVNQALIDLQTAMSSLNGQCLVAISLIDKVAAKGMGVIATDQRGLTTQRATLGFVRAASRVSAVETCEGNVQLTYCDDQGRMRQTLYDATADSQNSTFEQWLPDAPRVCVSLPMGASWVELASPLRLGTQWSVEAWFEYPLPKKTYNTLASSRGAETGQIVVRDGKHLGTRAAGLFLGSGHSLEGLASGWHHVAAVKRGSGRDASILFYVNGQRVGDPVKPDSDLLVLDGISDRVSLPPAAWPAGAQLTFCVWVKDAPGTTAGAQHLLRAADATDQELFSIRFEHLSDQNGNVVFRCGADTVTRSFTRAGSTVWSHWAFSKNVATGTVSIYRDGKLYYQETGKTAPLPAACAGLSIGWKYRGTLFEPSLWSQALPEARIATLINRPPSGSETGLSGSFRMSGTAAADRSPAARNGTFDGHPSLVPVSFEDNQQIDLLGNARTSWGPPVHPMALTLDGVQDHVQLNAASIPAGNQITIAFWAKGSSVLPRSTVFLFAPASTNETFHVLCIHLPWADGTIYFDCGTDASGQFDRIGRGAAASDYKDTWAYWAFTKNAATGEMKIFRNGALWHSETGRTKPITTAQKFGLGAMFDGGGNYPGQIAELTIWSKALSESEIGALMSRPLTGTEANLTGYWQFQAGRATDMTPSARHGVYVGSPQAAPANDLNVAPPPPGQSFGKIAEARVWSVALSDDEVAVNSKTLLTGNEPGLLAYYPMSRPTAGDIQDATGTGPTGALLGGAFWAWDPPIGNLGRGVLSFNGVDNHVVLPEMNVDYSRGFTVEAWVRYDKFNSYSRIIDLGNGPDADNILFALWGAQDQFLLIVKRAGGEGGFATYSCLLQGQWMHVAATVDSTNVLTLYLNGNVAQRGGGLLPASVTRSKNYIGRSNWAADGYLAAQLAELRIWNKARTQQEIQASMNRRLAGTEDSLVGYWPLDEVTPEGKVLDRTMNARHGTVVGATALRTNTLPVGLDAVISAEYDTVALEPGAPKKMALMRRFFAGPADGGALLLPDKRVEALDLQWIGNGQFAPTLLGYIEGAPPVPTENLTVADDYNGATSVELVISQDTEYRWNRSEMTGLGASLDAFAGADLQVFAGAFAMTKTVDVHVGGKGTLNQMNQQTSDSSVSSRSSERMSDRLSLRGTQEETPKFPNLGPRFIPKNVGYALVISGLADTFVTKLRRTGRMVGYQVLPVDGIPPDVNTITFMMNPAYVMQGSLDGMTGSRATSDRYFRHVPEMRTQYGALYPASYYRLQEAYALKQKLEAEDKRREAYFLQFSASDPASFDGGGPGATSAVSGDMSADQSKAQATAEEKAQAAEVDRRLADIDSKIQDEQQRAQATAAFNSWQRRMEDILIRAGKRNIVNTYVWDADGGLRSEQQSFASTVEHTIGGSFNLDSGFGLDSHIGAGGFSAGLTAMANLSLNQTMSKTESSSTGVELNVDLSGVEYSGITDYKDRPVHPGEKVDRYRFMSFYLDGSTNNFNDFFRQVVDPEWLQSNSEEARALRQAMGKANKAWRVMHRVTYVERPALMGFGRDTRQFEGSEAVRKVIADYFYNIDVQHADLVNRVNNLTVAVSQILAILKK